MGPVIFRYAVLEVVASGCGNSTPKQVNLTIIPETIPFQEPNEITEPYFLSDTGHAIEEVFCNGEIMGPLPECEVTESTPNTQFFSHSVGETNDYASLEWRNLSNHIPGDPSVPSPGVINAINRSG